MLFLLIFALDIPANRMILCRLSVAMGGMLGIAMLVLDVIELSNYLVVMRGIRLVRFVILVAAVSVWFCKSRPNAKGGLATWQ